ncbi:sialidase family protein [Spirosoma pulveris]
MNKLVKTFVCFGALLAVGLTGYATDSGKFSDTTRAYAVPTLTKTPKGAVALSWTEKDADGIVHFYWAESADKGRTFGDKKLIFSSAGIGNSRLMRPKLLFKKDGTPVAVFALRGPGSGVPQQAAQAPQAEPAHTNHEAAAAGHDHGTAHQQVPSKGAQRGGGRPSDLQIVYTYSNDQGKTWSQPLPVHADKTPNIVRGFFDATVLPNGEIGVAYLNDIEGKQHQRDMRFVSSKGNQFSRERIIDPFVCDCCNISLLVDNSGTLNLYYRENQDNIRDIAKMSSTDNGATFTKSEILFKDNWQINGCPHSGPTSSVGAGTNLIAWFSGTQESPGIRVVNQQGKRLFVLDEPTAKNAYLVAAPKASVLLWEQNQTSEAGINSVIAYKNIKADQNPATQLVKNAINGTNASGLVVDNQLLVAYEVKQPNNKNSVALAQIDL